MLHNTSVSIPIPNTSSSPRRRFGSASHSFFEADCSTAGDWLTERGCRFNAILAAGVLHHLDDREVRELLDLAVIYCEPNGFSRPLTVRLSRMNILSAAALIRGDRGRTHPDARRI